jgi:leader peptidase (prepilin peptidase)/N-methyltransferase
MMSVLTLIYCFIVFLCLGSFLNVVIYRAPKNINIVYPNSSCPHCHHKLHWRHNIPLLSYLMLKGKCAFCHRAISKRYFIVELITGVIGIILFWHYGMTFNLQFIAVSILSFVLIILIFIDLEYQLLPDIFTLGLLWLGLLFNLSHLFASPSDAIIGAACGYLSLWSIAMIYKHFTKNEGMGHGDFKLLAALGAWTGWQSMINIILIASLSGLLVGGYLMLKQKVNSRTPLAFGPYLAIAGWIMLIWPHPVIYST